MSGAVTGSTSEPSRRFWHGFGATGYLLNRYSSIWFAIILLIAVVSGIGAAAIVFWFLVKVLMAHEARSIPPITK